MKNRLEAYLWLLPAVAAFLWSWSEACCGYESFAALRQQQAQLERQEELLRDFAAAHYAYGEYHEKLRQSIRQAEKNLPGGLSSAAVMQQAQQLGAVSGVDIILMQQAEAKKELPQDLAGELAVHPVSLTAQGDYRQMLLWLKSLEQSGFSICRLRLQGDDATGLVRAELVALAYGRRTARNDVT